MKYPQKIIYEIVEIENIGDPNKDVRIVSYLLRNVLFLLCRQLKMRMC